MAYIYKITNVINGKCYIGKTHTTIHKRWLEHCRTYKKTNVSNRPLYKAMRKYGVENFCIEEIEQTEYPEEREPYWINFFDSFHNGYNATLGGDGKPYVDYDLVVETYLKFQSIKDTAEAMNIDVHTVRKIIRERNISYDPYCRIKVAKCDLDGNILQEYESIHMAADEIYKKRKVSDFKSIVSFIGRCCKTGHLAYGYKWIYT